MTAPLDPAIQAAAERGLRTSALIEREMAHLRGSLRIIWDVGGYPAAMRAISLALSIVSEEAKSFAADTKAAGGDDRTFRDKPFSTIGGKLKPKDLCMIPNRLAIALQEAGWWVRSEIVWGKPNPMPDSSGKYRPSTAHEKVFLLTKTGKGYYDPAAVAMPVSGNANARTAKTYKMPDGWNTGPGGHGSFHPKGREKGKRPGVTPKSAGEDSMVRAKESFHASTTGMMETRYLRNYERAPLAVWEIASQAFSEAHFATFPPELAQRCLMAGCPTGGTVLDPFGGAGTVGLVAGRLGLDCTLIELNPEYAEIADRRLRAGLVEVTGVKADNQPALPLFGGEAA